MMTRAVSGIRLWVCLGSAALALLCLGAEGRVAKAAQTSTPSSEEAELYLLRETELNAIPDDARSGILSSRFDEANLGEITKNLREAYLRLKSQSNDSKSILQELLDTAKKLFATTIPGLNGDESKLNILEILRIFDIISEIIRKPTTPETPPTDPPTEPPTVTGVPDAPFGVRLPANERRNLFDILSDLNGAMLSEGQGGEERRKQLSEQGKRLYAVALNPQVRPENLESVDLQDLSRMIAALVPGDDPPIIVEGQLRIDVPARGKIFNQLVESNNRLIASGFSRDSREVQLLALAEKLFAATITELVAPAVNNDPEQLNPAERRSAKDLVRSVLGASVTPPPGRPDGETPRPKTRRKVIYIIVPRTTGPISPTVVPTTISPYLVPAQGMHGCFFR